MASVAPVPYEPVDASPVKSFFVSMLTRDITLEEAILDLLDNCVDGILRSSHTANKRTPYAGFSAEIDFDGDSFSIHDNCGGIPWALHDYAFRMGRAKDRPKDEPGTVGVYGIGMKRAIFKLGRDCLISTQSGDHRYEVEFSSKWMGDEEDWSLPVEAASKAMKKDGTTIVVGKLHRGIAARFGEDGKAFKAELIRMIATHYAFIIAKGFEVKVNRDSVRPKPTQLIFTPMKKRKGAAIRPYIFKTTTNGISVFLVVGFTRPIPSSDEATNEDEEKKYSSLDAGWTVVCNDRAVLYCDRTELTGWGEAGVPRYHNQFIAISGIVEFRADDPAKLPTTTTKRGIDASSPLYLQIKNKMREGMRLFTDYTNKWKGRADESRKQMEAGSPLGFEALKVEARTLRLKATVRSVPTGQQFKPVLPMPARIDPRQRRISFLKEVDEVRQLGEYLFDDRDAEPSVVGEKCFDIVLRESRK